MDIILANPRGFCAGVDRAIAIVERALRLFGAPIYVRHEVVHNNYVVAGLMAEGAVFVQELSEVPEGATVIFSAHGVSKAVRLEAAARSLQIFDATCPLVTKVHMEVARYLREGRECILIGHAGHPEVEGTLGQHDAHSARGAKIRLVESVEDASVLQVTDPEKLAFVTQTTLSMEDTAAVVETLRKRFPRIATPQKEDICYATQNRQDAVRALAPMCDVLIVVGSPSSSNSSRLREVAAKLDTPAYLVDEAKELEWSWFDGAARVGVTAGASAPEVLVQDVLSRLRAWGGRTVREAQGVSETVAFRLPQGLQ